MDSRCGLGLPFGLGLGGAYVFFSRSALPGLWLANGGAPRLAAGLGRTYAHLRQNGEFWLYVVSPCVFLHVHGFWMLAGNRFY